MDEYEGKQMQVDQRRAGTIGGGTVDPRNSPPRGYYPSTAQGGLVGNAPTPTTPVAGRLEELARNVEALHQSIGMMEERLAIALASSSPQAAAGMDKDRADNTQLGVILAELSNRVRQATYRINDITQRVEL